MKYLLLIVMLTGCAEPYRIDISQLSPEHQILFTQAADMEGVAVTTNGAEWEWSVGYDYGMDVDGIATYNLVLCTIRINPDGLFNCVNGGVDQHFISTSRHEIRHCMGDGQHEDNQNYLMFSTAPCWPVD